MLVILLAQNEKDKDLLKCNIHYKLRSNEALLTLHNTLRSDTFTLYYTLCTVAPELLPPWFVH